MLKQDRRAAAKKMNKLTVKKALETQIFFIEPVGFYKESKEQIGKREFTRNKFITEGFTIESDDLYSFVIKSTKETTSPIGVMSKLHIRHEDYSCSYGKRNAVNNSEGLYEVWIWGASGNGQTFLDSFETEEEAEDYIFNRTYEYDFMTDDQRDTTFYSTIEEAERELLQRYSDLWGVNIEVATQIIHHQKIADQIRKDREVQAKEEARQAAQADNERINTIAAEYAKMITPEAGESYKQTAARLSAAIGEKIEGRVFHAAVKLIRCK